MEYYLPEQGRPAFYALVYPGARPGPQTPARPQQILKVDSWKDGQLFARVFLSVSRNQYVVLSALSSIDDNRGVETARETWYRDDNHIMVEPYRMPAETIRSFTRDDLGIAKEEEPDQKKKLREIIDLMKTAMKGETLTDVLGRKYERERQAEAVKSVEELFRYGTRNPEQGRLPGMEADEMEKFLLQLIAPGSYHSTKELKISAEAKFPGLSPTELENALDRALNNLYRAGWLTYQKGEYLPIYRPYADERRSKEGSLDAFERDPRRKKEVERLGDQFANVPHWYTKLPETKDVDLYGTVQVLFFSNPITGRFDETSGGISVAFTIKGRQTPTFYYEQEFGGSHMRRSTAREALDYIRTGIDYRDEYFEAMKNGVTEEEYADVIAKRYHLPVTSGQYVLHWDPNTKVPKELEELAAGKTPQEIVRESTYDFRKHTGEKSSDQSKLTAFEIDPRITNAIDNARKAGLDDAQILELLRSMGFDLKQLPKRPLKESLSLKDLHILEWLRSNFQLTRLYLKSVLSASDEDLDWLQRLGLIAKAGDVYKLTQKGAEALAGKAFEREGSGWDRKLKDSTGYFTFRQWAVRNKSPDADANLLQSALEEARVSGADLAASEARAKVEEATEPNDHPWIDIHDAIDFETIEEKERMNYELRRRLEEIEPQVKELLQAGKITKEEAADILNLTPVERLTSKQKREFQTRISELEKEVEKLKAPPPTPQEAARAARREATRGNFSPEEIALLSNTFSSIFTRRTKREPFPREVDKFDDLIETLQRVKPALKFVQARIQVENLARQLSTVATAGRIVIRRGQARIQELLDAMLVRQLTPDEQDELARLQAGEELTTTEVIEYEPPTIYLIADAGPWKVAYPYRLGGYWTRGDAELNKANWESKGFKVRIEGSEG